MKTKLILIAALIIASVKIATAQTDAMYSQYMFNQMIINPGYTGNAELINLTLLDRHQWVGIDGAPVTQTLSIDAPFNRNKVGLGLSLYNDKIGIQKNTGLNLSYAYRIKMKKSKLAFGLMGGISHLRADFLDVKYSQTNNTDDPVFSYNYFEFLPTIGTGVFYSKDKFYIGLSSPNLLKTSIFQTGIKYPYKRATHYYFSTGGVIVANQQIKVKPSLLVKYVQGAPIEVDLNTNVWFYDVFAVGVSYRTGDSFLGMVELQLNSQFRLGYAYDYTITRLNQFNYGSHEFMLRYQFLTNKSRMVTPRYF